MKGKKTVALLFLSSSTLAYTQQEITRIIHQQIKNPLPSFSINKKPPVLNWQNLYFPRINGKFDVVVMENNNSLMFVYSPYSSDKSIYKSKDAGQHWQVLSSPRVNQIHHLISIDDKQLLLAGDNKIYLSKDQGKHWRLSATVDESCDKLFSSTPKLILLTTNFNHALPGLYRSIDGGVTFTPAKLGINDGSPFFTLGGRDNILLAGTDSIFISTNGGLLWKKPSVNWADKLLSSAAINNQNTIFLAANNKLYKTEVSGQTWELLPNDLGSIGILSIDANDRLYAVGQKEKSSLYRSLNDGQSWEYLHTFNQITEIKLLKDGKILVNTDEGILLSDESQLNYTKLADLPYANSTNEHIIALDKLHYFATALPYYGSLYTSNDAGKSWDIKHNNAVMDITDFNHQVVTLEFNGNNQQIMTSKDFGDTWQSMLEINDNYCHSLSSQHGGLIVNCNKDSYITRDLTNWTALKISKKNPISESYFSGKTIYITDGDSIQCSTDGLSWKYLLDTLNQHRTFISGYNDEILIIAINNAGIIKMTNNNDWDLINNGLSNFDFTSLIVIDSNHYLVSTNGGIFYTQNGGKDWFSENNGLKNLSVLSLSLYQNVLLAGTDGSGIFKSDYIQADKIF